MNLRTFGFVLVLVFASASAAQNADDCPRVANGNAKFVVADESGRAVGGATVLFTALNWDSSISQSSDDAGATLVSCVPAGSGYDVTVSKAGYAVAHVTADAEPEPAVIRVTMRRVVGRYVGRYVRVMHDGYAIPGATVKVTDSGGAVQTLGTDDEGVARFEPLRGAGDATFDVSLAGFISQRALVPAELRNGPVLFEIRLAPVCKGITVVHD